MYELATPTLLDSEKVLAALDIVLDNAFKFSMEGGKVECIIQADSPHNLIVTVNDEHWHFALRDRQI